MFQFDIPARILTIDYFGLSAEFAAQYRRKALLELHDLAYSMHTLGEHLEQGKRERIVAPNVKIVSEVIFGVATAIIIIGYEEDTSLLEHVCFCTTFGIVAARITSIESLYDDDTKYKANAIVCQQAGRGQPKKIEVRTVSEIEGIVKETIDLVKGKEFFISQELINIPFTDKLNHTEGELILMLIMPLVDYRPSVADCFPYGMEYEEKQGSWSPEVNKRRIVGQTYEDPEALITSLYIASTGISGVIMADSALWNGLPSADPPIPPEPKFNPFRILPIPMDSCISTGL